MSAALEYRTRDKSKWGQGPWQEEPDKAQWVDEATGLDCLIVRGPSGALCGYVGVPESHPWHGKDYGACTAAEPCEESWCDHRPESHIEVHGGLTFSDACHEPTRENWEKWRQSMLSRQSEARQYPQGDSARAWKEKGHLMDDYEAWRAYGESAFICHLPQPGRPERVWWFGFDCAHSGDLCPQYRELGIDVGLGYETYKGLGYVRRECARLADQLARITG